MFQMLYLRFPLFPANDWSLEENNLFGRQTSITEGYGQEGNKEGKDMLEIISDVHQTHSE